MARIAFWLGMQKGHLKDLLISNFIEKSDYTIDTTKANGSGKGKGKGKNNVKIVMLTYICAKMLCMISKTPKANVVRKYFIDIEQFMLSK